MTGIESLLGEVADDAKLYDVVETALRGGRRMRRVRHAMVGGGTFLAVLAVSAGVAAPHLNRASAPVPPAAPTPQVPTACDQQILPSPAGALWTEVTGADPTGRFIVGRSALEGSDERQVIIWDGGIAIPVGFPGLAQEFTDINSLGEAVGYSYNTDLGGGSYHYADGVFTKLAGDAHQVFAFAGAINDAGVIVGTIDIQQGPGQTRLPARTFPDGNIPHAQPSPVVWRSPSAQPEWLPMPSGSMNGWAVGIDEDGTIAGTVDFDDGATARPPTQAVAWLPDGTLVPLTEPVLVDGQPATHTMARGIRDGWVFGSATRSPDSVAFLWNVRTGEVRVPGPPGTIVADRNGHGWMAAVRTVGDPRRADVENLGLLMAGAATLYLPSESSAEGPRQISVVSISDDGTALAGTDFTGDPGAAVRWTCH